MPALSHEPFRSWFYQHWGRENCVISARTRHAEYPLYQQRLSVKAAWGGSEDYFIDGRRVAVDDDTFLILNDSRTYASRLRSRTPRELFRRLELCVDFIHAHYTRPVTLREIAAAAHLSPYHCLRVFKAVHASTPTEYLKNRRLSAAERLLRDTRMRVDEVAARVGFQNRTTLFRHMRRVRGVAPSEVRRFAADARGAAGLPCAQG